MTQRFLILGAAGFIGTHLCDALLSMGQQVRLFDREDACPHRAFGTDERAEWHSGNFNNSADIEKAVLGCDVVFHFVSTTLPKSSNDNPMLDVQGNLEGTLSLLEAARRSNVKKIVFVSSGGTVYGIPNSIPIAETHATDPLSSYGICKLAIEKYLHLYRVLHGLDYCVLRLANPFGERQRPNAAQGAVAVFLHRALNNEEVEIWGDGSVVRDYIYIADVVTALLAASQHTGEHRVFNIGSGQGKSLNDMLQSIESLIARPVRRRYLAGRTFDVPANVLDTSRAQQYLGWAPQTSFDEGLQKTLEWLSRTSR